MPRKKPLNNGKPIKTEPGAIRFIGKNDKIDQPHLKKLDKPE